MPRIIEAGPVTCNNKGHPICERRKDLVNTIASEVTHPDRFNPNVTWPKHKDEGRVAALFKNFQEEWSLPAESFDWFNKTANARWSDHKNRHLKAYYDAAKGNFIEAVKNRPLGLINEENWLALCEHFRTISTPDPVTGESKSSKCRSSRKKNKKNHGFGRTAIASWTNQYNKKFEQEPTAAHVFDKGYLRIDALKSGEDSSTSHQNPSGICADQELRVISEKLHQDVQQRINAGTDVSTASSQAVIHIFGKPKLGISHHKMGKGKSSTKQTKASLQQELAATQSEVQSLKSRLDAMEAYMQKTGKMPMSPSDSESDDEEDIELM